MMLYLQCTVAGWKTVSILR